MSRLLIGLGGLCSLGLVAGMAMADDPPAKKAPDLASTQVTLAIEHGGRHRLFRATILAIDHDVITVLTAASFVEGKVAGHPARLLVGGEIVEGSVVSVVCNPAHEPGRARLLPGVTADRVPLPRVQPARSADHRLDQRPYFQRIHLANSQQFGAWTTQEIPGPNNAIARFRFPVQPCQENPDKAPVNPAFQKLRPVNALVSHPFPPPLGVAVPVRMVGGDGREHAVRACNFNNPLWLEWGHAFDPVSDDSGAGVFILRETADGQLEPVLIGVVIGPDRRGGSASLVGRSMPWLANALSEPIPVPTSDARSPEGSPLKPAPSGR
jgi:hypothetical protein